jgi:hypothetical protein
MSKQSLALHSDGSLPTRFQWNLQALLRAAVRFVSARTIFD